MRNTYLLLACLASPSFLTAQHLGYNQAELLSGQQLKISSGNIDNQYNDIKGDAFFSPSWLPAAAISAKGARYQGLKMKYDIYKNKIYANVHDTIYDLTAAGIIQFILYPDGSDTTLRHIFQKGFAAGSLRPEQFVEVLAIGKLTFLRQPTLEVKEVNEDSFLAKVKKFIAQDYYYLITPDGQGSVVRLNKKTLEKEMADKWTDVTRYAKEKDLSFSEETGWIPIITFYNSLH